MLGFKYQSECNRKLKQKMGITRPYLYNYLLRIICHTIWIGVNCLFSSHILRILYIVILFKMNFPVFLPKIIFFYQNN